MLPRKSTKRITSTVDSIVSLSDDLPKNSSSASIPQSRRQDMLLVDKKCMSVLEMRSFQYFRERTIPQLSGFFDSPFWECNVLQAFVHEPAIHHAVIALGSLHERFEAEDASILRSNLDQLSNGFALEQYTLAIGHLIGPISASNQQALDVVLMACVLFTCFEVSHYVRSRELLTGLIDAPWSPRFRIIPCEEWY